MWWQLGLVGVVATAVALFAFLRRKRTGAIDVGRVSDAWLAEERGRNSSD